MQLAQLLAAALSDVELYKSKYESARARADRAERTLQGLHAAGSPASSPLARAGNAADAAKPLPEVASAKAVLDAEARAERAER